MAGQSDITIRVSGPLFEGDVGGRIRRSTYEEALDKLATRMMRGGRGLGVRRNVLSRTDAGPLTVDITSTRIWPRTKGTAWTRKNVRTARAMLPRVLRSTAQKIAQELGG